MANQLYAGFVYTGAGVAVNGATVDLLTRNTTTPVLATTTTNASGYWAISYATEDRCDVRITNGSSISFLKYDDSIQLETLEAAVLRIRNPADTFDYTLVPAAITADRDLNLPLTTATRTLIANDTPIADDALLLLGTDSDQVLVSRSTTLAANTALTGVLIGTPVTPALAANSLIIANATASGDILLAGNLGGNSRAYLFADVSADTLDLMTAGVSRLLFSAAGVATFSGQYFTTRNALTDGATIALDWDNGNVQSVTLGGNRTFTFANPRDGGRYVIILTQDATGSRTVTWPTMKWQGGSAPTLTTTANKKDIIAIFYDGTDYLGNSSLNH